MKMPDLWTREIVHRVQRERDYEIHVSIVTSKVTPPFVDVREFAVDIERYGRGVIFSGVDLDEIIVGLEAARAWLLK